MADNTVINAGTGGDTIATDDVAGVKFQRVKLVDGTLDSSTGIPGDATNGLDVDVTRVQGTVTTTIGSALPTGANTIGNVGVTSLPATAADGGSLPAVQTVVAGFDGVNTQVVKTDASGRMQTDGSSVTQPVSGTVTAQLATRTSGGLQVARVVSAASTNATSVKASAGQVYGWYVSNTNANPRYLKIYDKASAPTVGSDTPLITALIPGSATGAGATVSIDMGVACASGVAFALTTGAADADTGAVAASEVIVNVFYA